MKKITYTYIVSLVAVGSFLVGVGLARAESMAGFAFSGTDVRYTVGAEFTTSVSLMSDALHRADTAEGTLSFNGLTCKSITLAEGVVAQSVPSCEHPSFLVGVPGGIDGSKQIFNVTLVGTKNGDAVLDISGVDILAAGVSLSRNVSVATYGIGTKVIPAEVPAISNVTEDTGTSTAGDVSTTTDTTASSTDSIAEQTPAVVSTTTNNGLLATVGNALYGIPSASVLVLAVLAIALFAGLLYYRRILPKDQI